LGAPKAPRGQSNAQTGRILRVRGAVSGLFEGARCLSGPKAQKGTLGRDPGPKPENKRARKHTFRAGTARDPPDSATFRGPRAGGPGKSRKSQKLHWYSERVSAFSAPAGPKRGPGRPGRPGARETPRGRPGQKGPEKGQKEAENTENTPERSKTNRRDSTGFSGPAGPEKAAFRAPLGPKAPNREKPEAQIGW